MEEKIIVLNESDYKTKESILLKISKELNFSDTSIKNLDALRDCLSEIFYPVTFLIIPTKDKISFDYMLNVYNALVLIAKESKYIKITSLRKINKLEYLLDTGNFRTSLSDFYLKKDKDYSFLFGVYDENENIIGLIQATNVVDTYLIRDVVCNEDTLLVSLISELSNIYKVNKFKWLIESADSKSSILEKNGWKINEKRFVYTIYRNKKNIHLAKPIILFYNIYSKLMRNKGFVVMPLENYCYNVKEDILSITDEEKSHYVKLIFEGYKGNVDFKYSFVLIKNNEIVSYLLNSELNKTNLEELYLYTPKKLRRKGYARYLIFHMIKIIYNSKHDAIRFYVRENNVESYNLVDKYLNSFAQKNTINVYTYNK